MAFATVYFWDKGFWNKMATYSKAVALEVIHDNGTFERLGTDHLCVIDDVTGEVIAENERRN